MITQLVGVSEVRQLSGGGQGQCPVGGLETQVQGQARHESSALLIPGLPDCAPFNSGESCSSHHSPAGPGRMLITWTRPGGGGGGGGRAHPQLRENNA